MKETSVESAEQWEQSRSGAELVEYWRREGLLGYRSEILDGAAHARRLRRKAERRRQSAALRHAPTRER